MTVTLCLKKAIDVRKILYKILMNIGFYILSLKMLGLRPRIFKLDKNLFKTFHLHVLPFITSK